jgi:hypothetical protein
MEPNSFLLVMNRGESLLRAARSTPTISDQDELIRRWLARYQSIAAREGVPRALADLAAERRVAAQDIQLRLDEKAEYLEVLDEVARRLEKQDSLASNAARRRACPQIPKPDNYP